MPDKPKFPRVLAIAVARELCSALAPLCERLIVAGSLRRRKAEVGDVELVFVPRADLIPTSLFGDAVENSRVDPLLELLIGRGVIERRLSAIGAESWGKKNKLAWHVASGVPVDLFATSQESWWNYVVCRTGGARSNVEICRAAIRRGWQWNPYGAGFSRAAGLGRETEPMGSERAVFDFAGLEYREPWERE